MCNFYPRLPFAQQNKDLQREHLIAQPTSTKWSAARARQGAAVGPAVVEYIAYNLRSRLSVASSATDGLVSLCLRPVTLCALADSVLLKDSGTRSMFLSTHPRTVYLTFPAKCFTQKISR